MKRRLLLALPVLALSLGAWAAIVISGNPTDLRPVRDRAIVILGNPTDLQPKGLKTLLKPSRGRTTRPETPPAAPQLRAWSAPVTGLVAIDLEGNRIEIPVSEGQDLADPLPVPATPVADLELTLGGPLVLRWDVAGFEMSQALKDLEPLTIALEDPERAAEEGRVVVDLSALPFLGEVQDVGLAR